jgi:hypothetical protein
MAGKWDRWRPASNPVLLKLAFWPIPLLPLMGIYQRTAQAMSVLLNPTRKGGIGPYVA